MIFSKRILIAALAAASCLIPMVEAASGAVGARRPHDPMRAQHRPATPQRPDSPPTPRLNVQFGGPAPVSKSPGRPIGNGPRSSAGRDSHIPRHPTAVPRPPLHSTAPLHSSMIPSTRLNTPTTDQPLAVKVADGRMVIEQEISAVGGPQIRARAWLSPDGMRLGWSLLYAWPGEATRSAVLSGHLWSDTDGRPIMPAAVAPFLPKGKLLDRVTDLLKAVPGGSHSAQPLPRDAYLEKRAEINVDVVEKPGIMSYRQDYMMNSGAQQGVEFSLTDDGVYLSYHGCTVYEHTRAVMTGFVSDAKALPSAILRYDIGLFPSCSALEDLLTHLDSDIVKHSTPDNAVEQARPQETSMIRIPDLADPSGPVFNIIRESNHASAHGFGSASEESSEDGPFSGPVPRLPRRNGFMSKWTAIAVRRV